MTRTWLHEVEAYNTATDSDNRIHADDVARQFGFRGGLVPGVDVWAYLTRPCVDRWGADFVTRGTMDARFHTPLYDGEVATAALADDGALTLTGPDGTVRATGTAGLVDAHDVAPDVPAGGPTPRLQASEESLVAGTVLDTVRFTFRTPKAAEYLADIRDDHPLYEGGAVAHPAFWARMCNTVLAAHVVLGPWIHVGTAARHRGMARDGAAIEVRGVVRAERAHKGHRFVDLDVTVAADDTLVFDAFHTAIWRPRGV